MADVLIVGGGITGSTLAILLARQRLTVELYEQGRFPKEKVCGEGLMPAGVAVLERMGLAEAVGGAPFYGVRCHLKNLTAEGRFPETQGMPVQAADSATQSWERKFCLSYAYRPRSSRTLSESLAVLGSCSALTARCHAERRS
jgi:2-polyprenyl-6-methoxyphenol hydroxylase-like FAD-dependent oxidoreductase